MKPVLLIGGAIAAVGVTAGVAYVAVPGGGDEEIAQQVATETPSATAAKPSSPTPSATASAEPSPTASPAPVVTPAPVPADWLTHSVPGVGVTVAYAPGWFLAPTGTRVASFELANWDGKFPPGGVSIDFERVPLDQAAPRPKDATPIFIAGVDGWETAGPREELGGDATWAWYHFVAVERSGYRYYLLGYFGDANPDESVFQEVLKSFQFSD